MTKKEEKFVESIKHGGTHSFFKRAVELGVAVNPLKKQPKVIKLTYGGKDVYVRSGSIPTYKMMGQFTKNKSITKAILEDQGIKVPKGVVLKDKKGYAKSLVASNKLHFPLIVKPQNSSRANGVTWDIKNLIELEKAVAFAAKSSDSPIMIEEMFLGEEYRVLVLNGRVIGVVHKVPPTIYGDGKCTVNELIEKYNSNRAKEKYLKVDSEVRGRLRLMEYNLKSTPKTGEKLQLKNTFLMSEGARLVSVNGKASKYFKEISRKSVSVLNLNLGGVDIIAKDITKKSPYVVLEVNPNPYYNMHEKELVEGAAVDVSLLILQEMFPALKRKRG